MKKILLILIVVGFLCGCEKTKPEYLVSSIGFEYENHNYNVYFESVIINSENTEQTIKVLKGSGKSIEKAVAQIHRQCTQPLLLSHCGIIVVQNNTSQKVFEEICDYCYSEEQITLSAYFINTPNVEKLLSVKPISSACVGYDIMGLLEQNKNCKNRFYEILNNNYKVDLPIISLKDGGVYFGS